MAQAKSIRGGKKIVTSRTRIVGDGSIEPKYRAKRQYMPGKGWVREGQSGAKSNKPI